MSVYSFRPVWYPTMNALGSIIGLAGMRVEGEMISTQSGMSSILNQTNR
jgi:hypothetical protein